MFDSKTSQPRELACRISDGIEVTLWWHGGTELTVQVLDRKTGLQFELDAPAENALVVFYHPFAHRAATSCAPLAYAE